jgi:hypothetical protein
MRLDFLFEYTANLGSTAQVGQGPLGARMVADVIGGTFEGPKMKGKVRASGADWALIDAGGAVRVDVRLVLETDDGAVIYMPYRGRMVINEAIGKILTEGEGATDYGDNYWVTQVQFETGDERYAWLNNVMAVGEGKLAPNVASYRVFAVQPD